MKAEKTKRESASHKKLAQELVSLIPSLDEAGLAFLVEQACVHIHNMEIERQEAEEAMAAKAEKPAGKKTGKKAETLAGKKSSGGQVKESPANFRIERSSSGSSYHLISGGKWKMFNEDEMMAIVKIAGAADPVNEVAYRLHAWFTGERPDTFADLEIGDRHDPKMRELVLFLRSKFAIKKR